MIVLDASAAVAALLNAGESRKMVEQEQLHVPHLIDPEVASALRRRVLSGRLGESNGRAALDVWSRLGMTRYPINAVLSRIWELRDNLSAYDASYVAVAEQLGCSLVTADARLGQAPGIRCTISVVPN
ncbi:type II toxin-antitoxin system VapC family toxin [Antrihabitans stalactiti]|uniref:Ribonuclease VapC n=1 Tax=Antrihabitans stalactiti TaxID=2584121 RepID=A0A848KGG8_9NOCA|nr:type II toxin-antitoxin system VapC family toxin [Antrihabitans stalactiti]NMN97865.1 PIN domain-containing protein [Antrihabitans stalactiti]